MASTRAHPGYSLIWAIGVVSTFTGKYVRATEAVQETYGFDNEMVATWVADWPSRWRNYKLCVKLLDRWDKQQLKVRGEHLLLNGCVVDAVKFLKKSNQLHDF